MSFSNFLNTNDFSFNIPDADADDWMNEFLETDDDVVTPGLFGDQVPVDTEVDTIPAQDPRSNHPVRYV
jgi:hypothetical protein